MPMGILGVRESLCAYLRGFNCTQTSRPLELSPRELQQEQGGEAGGSYPGRLDSSARVR